jgi:hypothetical protein
MLMSLLREENLRELLSLGPNEKVIFITLFKKNGNFAKKAGTVEQDR